jgi:hypothetical protein
VSVGPQAMFVVEYPCDLFCRIEVEQLGERDQTTVQQLWEKADTMHRRIHEPDLAEEAEPVADPEAARRPAATVFRSAPGRGVERAENTQRSRHSRR